MLEDLKNYTRWFAGWVLVGYVIAGLYSITPFGRDDSDADEWGDGRSGVKIITDHLTGCEYLQSSGGGITPRLNKGVQVGCN